MISETGAARLLHGSQTMIFKSSVRSGAVYEHVHKGNGFERPLRWLGEGYELIVNYRSRCCTIWTSTAKGGSRRKIIA